MMNILEIWVAFMLGVMLAGLAWLWYVNAVRELWAKYYVNRLEGKHHGMTQHDDELVRRVIAQRGRAKMLATLLDEER